MNRPIPDHPLVGADHEVQRVRDRIRMRNLQTYCTLVLAFVGGVWAVGFLTSPRFAIRYVYVKGAQRVSAAAVRKQARYLMGRNFLRAKTDRLKQSLLTYREVERVRIRRWPPAALTVAVQERVPRYAVAARQGYLLVDQSGFFFTNDRERGRLPLVWVERTPPRIGGSIPTDQAHALVVLLEQAELNRVRPDRLFLDRDGFASMRLRGGTLVRLGDGDWIEKLAYLPAALRWIRDNHQNAEYIDLTTLRAPVYKPAVHLPPPGSQEVETL